MKFILTSLIFIFASLNLAQAGDSLSIYCDDETGEAMSEVYDAVDTATQFEIVGLNPSHYPFLVEGFGIGAWDGKDIWEIAKLEKNNLPEIYQALAIWVSKNCPAKNP